LNKEKAMKATKKSSPRTRKARAGQVRLRTAGTRIRKTWDAAVEAVTSAEAEAERQLRLLLARNRIDPAEARAALAAVRKRVDKERRKASRELDVRIAALQGRLRQERKNLVRLVDEAIRGTLGALNVPSRHEVSELTRKVDELSRKIDGYRKSSPRPRPSRRPAAAH